jgi:hypothetical protein
MTPDVNPSHVLDELEGALAKYTAIESHLPALIGSARHEIPVAVSDLRKLLAVARAAVAYREWWNAKGVAHVKHSDVQADLLRTTAALGDATGE